MVAKSGAGDKATSSNAAEDLPNVFAGASCMAANLLGEVGRAQAVQRGTQQRP